MPIGFIRKFAINSLLLQDLSKKSVEICEGKLSFTETNLSDKFVQ